MKTQLSHTDLLSAFESAEFVRKTQAQIVKDFSLSGIDCSAILRENHPSFASLSDTVGDKFAEIMRLGERQTLQVLYQIDIPQSDFLQVVNDPNFLPKISDLIIRREAYKVYLRSQF